MVDEDHNYIFPFYLDSFSILFRNGQKFDFPGCWLGFNFQKLDLLSVIYLRFFSLYLIEYIFKDFFFIYSKNKYTIQKKLYKIKNKFVKLNWITCFREF